MERYQSRSYSRRRMIGIPPRLQHYDDPHDCSRRGDGGYTSSAASVLFVNNLARRIRPEYLRIRFERFGPVNYVYLPKNHNTGKYRGFGFVKFCQPQDAAEAKKYMNHQIIFGRQISVVFGNNRTPPRMRMNAQISERGSYRRRSPSRSLRHRYCSDSRFPSRPQRRRSRDRYIGGAPDDDHYSRQRSIFPSHRDDDRWNPRSTSPERDPPDDDYYRDAPDDDYYRDAYRSRPKIASQIFRP